MATRQQFPVGAVPKFARLERWGHPASARGANGSPSRISNRADNPVQQQSDKNVVECMRAGGDAEAAVDE